MSKNQAEVVRAILSCGSLEEGIGVLNEFLDTFGVLNLLNTRVNATTVADRLLVQANYKNAQIYCYPHGKVCVCGNGKQLSNMMYKGTREKREADAWHDAAERLRAVQHG